MLWPVYRGCLLRGATYAHSLILHQICSESILVGGISNSFSKVNHIVRVRFPLALKITKLPGSTKKAIVMKISIWLLVGCTKQYSSITSHHPQVLKPSTSTNQISYTKHCSCLCLYNLNLVLGYGSKRGLVT